MSSKVQKILIIRLSWALTALFWLAFLFFMTRPFYPFFKTIYSISRFSKNYYSIEMSNDIPIYHETNTIPKTWIPLQLISKKLIGAIISSEDGKFYFHNGYDIEQLQKVIIEKFIFKKKKVRGASTITQQLVKNLYLTNAKSITRKAQELYLSTYIEEKSDKNKILESYLNLIEYGKGIYGIENAAHYYFNKNAHNLNAKESAFLAMLLPNPKKYARSFYQKELTPFASTTIDSILLKMRLAGYISEVEYQNSLNSPLSFESQSQTLIDRQQLIESLNQKDEIED